MNQELEAVVAEVLSSTRYRSFAPTLVYAVAREELSHRHKPKATVKAIKSKLHQVAGAFLGGKVEYGKALAALAADRDDPIALRQRCAALMASHASTRERLPILGPFYERVFAGLGPVRSVLDLGCGLNPLAIPWMPFAEEGTYHAYDVQGDIVQFLAQALPLLGKVGGAHLTDLTREVVDQTADVALLLKCLPTLEQLDSTASARLLATLKVPAMVVSFPIRSLGGREKGMLAGYEDHFRRLIAGQPWHVERLAFATELVFILRTAAAQT